MSWNLTWIDHGVIEKYSGAFSADEMTTVNEIVARDERFDALRWVIADFTDADVGPVADSHLNEAASMAYAVSFSNNRFIVASVNSSPIAFENAKKFESLDQPYPYHVCHTMEEACEWVNSILPNTFLGNQEPKSR